MCGRYAVYSNSAELAKIFAIKQSSNFEISYNVAPTEEVAVICRSLDGERVLSVMRWGLIPAWQNPPNLSSALINARIETIDSKPSFKRSVKHRRCLIIADGFYEWTHKPKGKQPYFVHRKDCKPFAMAGIWDKWVGETDTIDSCCIITIEANALLSPLHNRMPAIVKTEDYDKWLDGNNQNWEQLKLLLTEEPHQELEYYPVSTKVNSAKYKNSDCIERIIS